MTKRTWLFRFLTTLLILGLAACGGSGGGGGGGGGGIPTATNAAITPPPTTPVTITAAGGGTTSPANQSTAANGFQASQGALSNAANPASGLVAQAADSGTQAQRETLAEIVRRHAERLKDHQPSVTSALQVDTQPCSGGGTDSFAFDDASQSATEVFVTCNQGGTVLHGTLSSSNVSVVQNLGPTVGSPYVLAVTASFTIDLSVTTTAPARSVVTQGSFTFTVSINGNMQATGTGGVQPGPATTVAISMSGTSLLTSNGTDRELLSNFGISVINNVTMSSLSISGSYTYASTTINGAVMVAITGAIVFQPQGALHPSSGIVTITSPASAGKIVLTVISTPAAGVRVDAYANAAGPVTDTANLTWAQADAL
jgi:hypothetical protein